MTTFGRTSTSEEYTAAWGRSLGRLLRPGDVVLLHGPMGAGKTTLVRAVAEGLGIAAAAVSSPTFVIVNQYAVPPGESALAGGTLVHVDAYRLSGSEELDNAGWDRLFDADGRARGTAAAVIEWPERIGAWRPDPGSTARLTITPMSEHERRFEVVLPASWALREGAALFVEREPVRCRVSGRWVEPMSATYPFADERARMADLHGWFSGSYGTSRPPGPDDEENA